MVELGQIERPPAESFEKKRKLYCVPDVYPIKDAPEDYKGLVEKYWSEVTEQLERLEIAGKIKKIFCENIADQGEKAFDTLAKFNELAFRIVRKKVDEGAVIFPIESQEIFSPFLDWANCLNVVRTKEVFVKILEFYRELAEKRLQHAAEIINGSLAAGEAGLLIMRDEDRVRLQFPSDIEIFLVTPPSYDDIHRWFREKMEDMGGQGDEEKEQH